MKRIVNEIDEIMYWRFTAFSDSIAKARETAVGQTAHPTSPAVTNIQST